MLKLQIRQRLRNFKTRTKLIVSFGVMLLFSAIIAAVGLLGNDFYNMFANNLKQLYKSQISFVGARMHTQYYISYRKDADLQKAKMQTDSVLAQLREISENAFYEIDKAHADSIIVTVKSYREGIERIGNLVESELEILKKMQDVVSSILDQSLGFEQQNLLMTAQVNVLRTRTYNNIAFLDDAQRYLEKLVRLSSGSVKSRTQLFDDFIGEYRILSNELASQRDSLIAKGQELESIISSAAREMDSRTYSTRKNTILSVRLNFLVVFLIGVGIIFTITRFLTRSFNRVTQLTQEYGAGNLTNKIEDEYLELKDEIGDMSHALMVMRDKLGGVIAGVQQGALNVSSASVQANTVAQQMTEGSNEQASSVEEIASTMEEMTTNIFQNSQNAQTTSALTQSIAEEINGVKNQAGQSLDSIRSISEKIQIIDDIAVKPIFWPSMLRWKQQEQANMVEDLLLWLQRCES